jgi:hypothetical protein
MGDTKQIKRARYGDLKQGDVYFMRQDMVWDGNDPSNAIAPSAEVWIEDNETKDE